MPNEEQENKKAEIKLHLASLLDAVLDRMMEEIGDVRYAIIKNLKDMVLKEDFKDDVFEIVHKYTDNGETDEGTQKLEELNECMEALLNKVQELKGE